MRIIDRVLGWWRWRHGCADAKMLEALPVLRERISTGLHRLSTRPARVDESPQRRDEIRALAASFR
jgi:hypothetical protein